MCGVSECNIMFLSSVLMSAGASVHSTSSGLGNTPTSITQPTSTQATAFVQPTQQQVVSQDAGPSMEAERPSTSSSLIGAGEQDLVPNQHRPCNFTENINTNEQERNKTHCPKKFDMVKK